jgi:predicted DNA-binding transcriptional regulator YafY
VATSADFVKRDRTARLIGVAYLLFQHPHELTPNEIAERIGMNVRTVYRDLRALQDEVGVAVWQEGRRYGAEATSFLPPLKLTLHEAVTLFLSARLMARYADKRDQHVISAFNKLASILPPPLAQHVHAAVAALADRPRNDSYERIFELLATAWAGGRKVRITYPWTHPDGRVFVNERIVAPYFLEPNGSGHSCYLIAHDSYTNQMRTFKVERIRSAELTADIYEVPSDFNVDQRLEHAWGISDEDLVQVRLRFLNPAAARRANETRWHPSQLVTDNADGTVDLSLEVGGLLEITPWVLGWGDAVEVLAPAELRARVAATARNLAARYGGDCAPEVQRS